MKKAIWMTSLGRNENLVKSLYGKIKGSYRVIDALEDYIAKKKACS